MTIVKIKIGEKSDGSPKILRIDQIIRGQLDKVKIRVVKKNWDYIALVAGIPGSGKSTLARGFARYLCPWFDLKYIAFSGDEFVDITNECPEYSSVILDESFASLNSKVTMTEDFIKIINHLQLIRQKHLFIFLCLPNFFDLAKSIAIFRSSHLFVTYADDEGDRGPFLVFDRDNKRKLYVKGGKFMDYNAQKANFYATFYENQDVLDINAYDKLKNEHLNAQKKEDLEKVHHKAQRNEILWKLYSEHAWNVQDLSKLAGIDEKSIYKAIKPYRK
jgi:adenylate kinase family enzyme